MNIESRKKMLFKNMLLGLMVKTMSCGATLNILLYEDILSLNIGQCHLWWFCYYKWMENLTESVLLESKLGQSGICDYK